VKGGRQTVSRMREDAITAVDSTAAAEDEPVDPPPPPAAQASNGEHLKARSLGGQVVLIDFGLATQTIQDEDRAVDLYVLERAFAATHPAAEGLFQEVLKVYGTSFKGAQRVLKRLEDVRMRGRKKSMIG